MTLHVVVMGVAGSGKSAVGHALAGRLALPLIEGDAFHSPRNLDKMRRGQPLDDEDRAGWLQALASTLRRHEQGAVLTCSALKRAYRDVLRSAVPRLAFVHLAIGQGQAQERLARRRNHFFPPSLVASQFEALQDPAGEPGVMVIDATLALDDVIARAVERLEQAQRS